MLGIGLFSLDLQKTRGGTERLLLGGLGRGGIDIAVVKGFWSGTNITKVQISGIFMLTAKRVQ